MIIELTEINGDNKLVFNVGDGDEGVYLGVQDENGEVVGKSIIVDKDELMAAVSAVVQIVS